MDEFLTLWTVRELCIFQILPVFGAILTSPAGPVCFEVAEGSPDTTCKGTCQHKSKADIHVASYSIRIGHRIGHEWRLSHDISYFSYSFDGGQS